MVPTEVDAENYFLACSLPANGKSIALCYYSGVPGAPENTLGCTLSQGGNAAVCGCYEINVNTPGATGEYSYSYVELTGILRRPHLGEWPLRQLRTIKYQRIHS